MARPLKIHYDRLAPDAKGAAIFIGMVDFDDGTSQKIDSLGDLDLSALPIKHAVELPKEAAQATTQAILRGPFSR